jgi:hypothetical protein
MTRQNVMLFMAFLSVLVIAVVLALCGRGLPELVTGFLTTVGGMFARDISSAFNYEFGSSRGSADKTDLLSRAPAIEAKS